MSYRLSFTGVASPEINHLLTAIEHRLNGHASMSLAAEDRAGSATEIVILKCGPGTRVPCPDNNPRDPWMIVHGAGLLISVFAFGAVLGLGAGVALMLGRLKRR